MSPSVGWLVGPSHFPLCWCLWAVTEHPLTTGRDIFSECYDQQLLDVNFQSILFENVFSMCNWLRHLLREAIGKNGKKQTLSVRGVGVGSTPVH